MAAGARRGPLARRLKRRLRPWLSRPLRGLALAALPPLYVLYMRFVYRTSRVEDHGLARLAGIRARHGGAVALVWHEEIFGAVYTYPRAGYRPHTLASLSDAGALITRILERCGYVVFRGGSSRRRSRRRIAVLDEMIEHMRAQPDVLYGITVDGSRGPAYRMKRGGILIARECGVPIVLVRTWFARCVRLPTWDRTAIPLPFNTIRHALRGPYAVPADAHTPAGLRRFRRQLEGELVDLAAESYAAFGQPRPAQLVKRGERRAEAA